MINVKEGDSILFNRRDSLSVGQVYEIWPDEDSESQTEIRIKFLTEGYYNEELATILILADIEPTGEEGVWKSKIKLRCFPTPYEENFLVFDN